MPNSDYPIQKLLFFVAQDHDDALTPVIERFVDELSGSRSWSASRPVFLNESWDGLTILGGYLSIYSALTPHQLPPELDRRNLEEIKDFIQRLKVLSEENEIAFELELDGVPVGTIEDGIVDENLRVILLEEWERTLKEREAK